MDLALLIDALAPVEVVGRAPVDVTDLAYDARDAGPGSLYFCIPGSRADGHDFAPEAVANGAVALVVQRPLDLSLPQLVVEDARRASRRTSSSGGRPNSSRLRASPARTARRRPRSSSTRSSRLRAGGPHSS